MFEVAPEGRPEAVSIQVVQAVSICPTHERNFAGIWRRPDGESFDPAS